MRFEIPGVRRCCCCLPLRNSLLVWAYIKQVLNVVFLSYQAWRVSTKFEVFDELTLGFNAIVAAFVLTDFIFHLVFIKGAHYKDYKKLRVFYRYNIFIFCLFSLISCFHIGNFIYHLVLSESMFLFFTYAMIMALLVTSLVIQGYLVILVRSEFVKLKNNSQFKFVNKANEEQCTVDV